MREPYFESFSESTTTWFQETLGEPTLVQKQAWPEIQQGRDTLISAPTGTGKTLSAFLVFVDRLLKEAEEELLKQELQVIYISPLKSLATDIRENLIKPKLGIMEVSREQNHLKKAFASDLQIMIRTGDTSQSDRRSMIKKPPHILITTPESLFLMLSSKSGKEILKTAKTVIIDELHALIDSKRGAHFMLSLARLETLCQHRIQKIGLSATIEPLSLAANYLTKNPCSIVAPKMEKKIQIKILNSHDGQVVLKKDGLWREIATEIYDHSLSIRSGIVFCDGRAFVERIAYHINQVAGEGYARCHHGSLSKEQRHEAEIELRNGTLKLLCATSSMELGIDVGELDLVFQIGCPKSIASTMQRLGRAGHKPGKVSVMEMFPRTSMEGIYCAMTANMAKIGGIEHVKPPMGCFDILAQHLVSMAATEEYRVDDILSLLSKTYSFSRITREEIEAILEMLSGDYEHEKNISFRPRILYDRINQKVFVDNYSRMLAVSAGGTIPDKGLYSVKTEQGLKIGEVDEEFVFESKVGERFLLGSFSWQIQAIQRDNVIVKQTQRQGARAPFYKAENYGRNYQTGIAFGGMMEDFQKAFEENRLLEVFKSLSMDETAASNGVYQIKRQIEMTSALPNQRTIILEHFKDDTGANQLMVHSIFGKKVNSPCSLLLREILKKYLKTNVTCYEDDDGFLLFPYGDYQIPEGLFGHLIAQYDEEQKVRELLEALLPSTPVFHLTFRYNAARALMMGIKNNRRQPLWIQRLRSAQLLDTLIQSPKHPLILETKRECLEDLWDIDGLLDILNKIKEGSIEIIELHTETPSPFSLPLRRQTEAVEMYNYTPIPQAVHGEVIHQLEQLEKRKADKQQLLVQGTEKKAPESPNRLHSLFMAEGDFLSTELDIPLAWLQQLIEEGRITYIEPGLWIAKEQESLYEQGLLFYESNALKKIVERSLRYRGGQSFESLRERYFLKPEVLLKVLEEMVTEKRILLMESFYYQSDVYELARKKTILLLRQEITTVCKEQYAGFLLDKLSRFENQENGLELLLDQYLFIPIPMELFESGILNLRLKRYRESMLDELLKQGKYHWNISKEGKLLFFHTNDIDWEFQPDLELMELSIDEKTVYEALWRRGSSLLASLQNLVQDNGIYEVLLSLIKKGYVYADSFLPIRHLLSNSYGTNKSPKQRALVKTQAKDMIYFQIVRPHSTKIDKIMGQIFDSYGMISKETMHTVSFGQALSVLRIMEYTGQVRRGYFVEGLSGIQFIRDQDFSYVTGKLQEAYEKFQWLMVQDPFQPYGNILALSEKKDFMLQIGSILGFIGGKPVLIFEKGGKVLRILDHNFHLEDAKTLCMEFLKAYDQRKVLVSANKIKLSLFPKELESTLLQVGFQKEITDLIYYRKIQM